MKTKLLSRFFGKFASYSFPKPIQNFINRAYVRIFGIDLSEFEPLESYPSLNALFTRRLAVPRAVCEGEGVWIAPCDSCVMQKGRVEANVALQIKGMSYCVSELLGEVLEEGYAYINLYLSPKDYHRYHAPCDLEVLELRYFGGELLPVNRPSLLKNHNLFIRNERVVVVARDRGGKKFYYVAVGALNVGKMVFHFEPRIMGEALANTKRVYAYSDPIKLAKGEEMGLFEMGSTILLFASDFEFEVEMGEHLRFGESLGRERGGRE